MVKTLRTILLVTFLGGALVISSATFAPQDGPVSVTYGGVYKTGSLKIEPHDLTNLPGLPAGYSALDDKAYLITTTAVVGPPQVVHFKTSSITDREVFEKLRIFHAEPDNFDPDAPRWVDVTLLSPDPRAPDFSTRSINSESTDLGVFVIGKLMAKVPPSPGVADLAVACTSSANPVRAPNNVTYTCRVTNNGPQVATEAGLNGSPTPDGTLVSSNASQGSCKFRGGNLYCKLGTLAVGASATVVIVIKPYEGFASFPREGKMTATGAAVGSREVDNNPANDSVTEMTLMLPDPNLPPRVEIESPKSEAYLVGPTALTIDVKASDPDGSVDKVEIFDNGELIGAGSRSTPNHFTFSVRELQFGPHILGAVATDDKGRWNEAGRVLIIVNGSARVEIVSPLSGSVILPGTDLTLTASARAESGILKKVEFFLSGISLGEGAQVQPTQYTLRFPKLESGQYEFVAVATDGSEVSTTSAPIRIKVSTIPKVSLVRPAEAARFRASTNVSIIARAENQAVDEVRKVDLYANGEFIGHMTNDEWDVFRFTWRSPQTGVYVLTAVATNPMGVTGESGPVKMIVVGSQRKK